ncbi:hypothetical protein CRENBAI_001346 [Crenichthys baileyi]|uniref:Uncharacterized protein n=1 Tax=Crenichthys baileyi TaxID=28760 RepID=A0AAV9QT14_9TELE
MPMPHLNLAPLHMQDHQLPDLKEMTLSPSAAVSRAESQPKPWYKSSDSKDTIIISVQVAFSIILSSSIANIVFFFKENFSIIFLPNCSIFFMLSATCSIILIFSATQSIIIFRATTNILVSSNTAI